MAFKYCILLAFVSVSLSNAQLTGFNFNLGFDEQPKETTTPIPILRYIDTQNPDGSYTYGYESGDGTYKIETRYATGEVKGKYGYYDDTGLLREVEYGATPTGGFNPSGSGLNLADAPVAPVAPVTPAPVAPAAPVIAKPDRRVTVVRRRRPQQPRESSRNTPDLTTDRRVQLPQQRRRQNAINRNLPIDPRTTTQSPRFNAFQPVERVQPVQRAQPVQRRPRPQPVQQRPVVQPVQPVQPVFNPQSNSDRFVSNIDLNTGSYTISY